MITEATPTEDIIATICNARALRRVSFEDGCCVLEAIAMYDRRCGGGRLGTWRKIDALGPLTFVPVTAAGTSDPSDPNHQLTIERLARDVVAWTIGQGARPGILFTAWVVIDRTTRVAWVECSPVKDRLVQHPRAAQEAGEFPSSSQGAVAAHVALHTGTPWRAMRDGVLEAYHEARSLLDGEAS